MIEIVSSFYHYPIPIILLFPDHTVKSAFYSEVYASKPSLNDPQDAFRTMFRAMFPDGLVPRQRITENGMYLDTFCENISSLESDPSQLTPLHKMHAMYDPVVHTRRPWPLLALTMSEFTIFKSTVLDVTSFNQNDVVVVYDEAHLLDDPDVIEWVTNKKYVYAFTATPLKNVDNIQHILSIPRRSSRSETTDIMFRSKCVCYMGGTDAVDGRSALSVCKIRLVPVDVCTVFRIIWSEHAWQSTIVKGLGKSYDLTARSLGLWHILRSVDVVSAHTVVTNLTGSIHTGVQTVEKLSLGKRGVNVGSSLDMSELFPFAHQLYEAIASRPNGGRVVVTCNIGAGVDYLMSLLQRGGVTYVLHGLEAVMNVPGFVGPIIGSILTYPQSSPPMPSDHMVQKNEHRMLPDDLLIRQFNMYHNMYDVLVLMSDSTGFDILHTDHMIISHRLCAIDELEQLVGRINRMCRNPQREYCRVDIMFCDQLHTCENKRHVTNMMKQTSEYAYLSANSIGTKCIHDSSMVYEYEGHSFDNDFNMRVR